MPSGAQVAVLALSIAAAYPALAQPEAAGRYVPLQALSAGTAAPRVAGERYAANAAVAQLQFSVSRASAPADGVTPVAVSLLVLDAHGQPLAGTALVTIEASGGRIQLPGARTDEFGPGRLDADRNVPGTQLAVVDGKASFQLVAPAAAQDVTLRLTAGAAEVSGVLGFTPDLREMMVVGLVEGVISLNRGRYDQAVVQAGVNDGFEQSLRAWSRTFHDGEASAAATAAVFLKGKIKGDMLLTLAYDSDKPPATSLLSQVKPEEYYPVYGDGSVRSFDAVSASKLYVRLDEDHNFLLYGDFNSGATFSPGAGGGMVAGGALRQLGAYTRSATGVRGHYEGGNGYVNGFATRDTLRQLVQEWQANGTSGPFAVANSNGLQNSETIDIVVRDKNVLSRILSVTPLTRLIDYVFEPFSGRVLLTRPVASLDPQGNPVSLRIGYAVDQGGDPFWVLGVDGEARLGAGLVVGGNLVEDRNPAAPFRLASGNAGVALGAHTRLSAEVAQTEALPTLAGLGQNGAAPALPDEVQTGRAARIELEHKDDALTGRAWINRTGAGFANPSASALAGTQEAGLSVALKAGERLTVGVDAQKSEALASDAERTALSASVTYQVDPTLALTGGVRRIGEHGAAGRLRQGLAANPGAASYFSQDGGGFGGAAGSSLLNANNAGGALLNNNLSADAGSDLSATTVFIGAKKKLGEKVSVEALAEGGDHQHRLVLGASWQLAERARLYGRLESQTGLGSAYSLDDARRSNALSLGVDSSYMEGGTVFSEYRMRDANSATDAQIATGVRNVWHVGEGVALTTGAERLQLLEGSGQAATALTGGVDYTGSQRWKGSARLEWRRLGAPANPDPAATLQGEQDTLLMTVAAARKLDRDWTVLGRNYLLMTDNHGSRPNGWQDRFQIGAAYRPVDIDTFDMLSKYEYKTENDVDGQAEFRRVHVLSVQGAYHPSRPWWLSGRLAAKSVNERFPATEGGASSSYRATLVGMRAVYDITENWDVGVMSSVMFSNSGSARQRAHGIEVGRLLRENLWLSVGYNMSGFSDADLSSDYTARGVYLRLRFKFDKDLFSASNKDVNRALDR